LSEERGTARRRRSAVIAPT